MAWISHCKACDRGITDQEWLETKDDELCKRCREFGSTLYDNYDEDYNDE